MESPLKLFSKVSFSPYTSNVLIVPVMALFSICLLLELLTVSLCQLHCDWASRDRSSCCSSEYSSFQRCVLHIIWFLNSVQLLHLVLNQKRKKSICSQTREKNWLYWTYWETVYQFQTWHRPKRFSRASLPLLNFCFTCWL